MCGRFVASTPAADVAAHFGATGVDADLPARWNVTPSSEVWVVVDVDDGARIERRLDAMRWGLVPSWAKDPAIGNRLINARSETAATKPSFRSAYRRRRCLVPADGFYEWAPVAGQRTRQPWYFASPDGTPLGLAGLWEERTGDAGVLRTCTILTTASNEVVAPVHARMPVVLAREVWDVWLDPHRTDPDAIDGLVGGNRGPELEAWPVDTAVGNPRHDGPALVEPRW